MAGDMLRRTALHNRASEANTEFRAFQLAEEQRRRVRQLQQLETERRSINAQPALPAVRQAASVAQQEVDSANRAYDAFVAAESPGPEPGPCQGGTRPDPVDVAYERLESAEVVLEAWKGLEERIVKDREAGVRLNTWDDVAGNADVLGLYEEALEAGKAHNLRFPQGHTAGPQRAVAQAAQLSQYQAGTAQVPAGSFSQRSSGAVRPRPWEQGRGPGRSSRQGGPGMS